MADKLKDIEDKISKAADAREKIDLQNQLANELRLKEAKQSLSIAENVFNSALQINYSKGMAEALRIQSAAHNTLSNFDISFQKAIEALDIFRNINDRAGEGVIMNLLANNSFGLGDYENSLKYNLLCMQIREELNDDVGIMMLMGNIGNVYAVKKDYDNALKHYLKGLELLRTGMPDENSNMAVLLGNIGSIYAYKGEYSEALEFYKESLQAIKEDRDQMIATNNYNNMAEIYLILKDLPNSQKYYSLALEKVIRSENKPGEAVARLGLGKVAYAQNEISEAIAHLESSFSIAEKYLYKAILPDIYLSLSDVFSGKGDYAKALDYHKKFYKEKEEEFNEDANRKMQNLLTLHQVDTLKKESESHRVSNAELKKLNEDVEIKNRSIMESIDYAKHIQDSILPHPSSLKQYFSDSFVFHKPKDIISGDFFWLFEKENEVLIAAVDCTGHGVSGALMSVVSNSVLNQVTANQWMPNPSFILNEANHYMQRTLAAHDDSGLRDSMDIALCSISKTKTDLLFSGAHNSLYVISEGTLIEYKGDNISIGNSASVKFSNHKVKLKKGDCLYIFTDGFADQKGGVARKKFYYDPFKNLLLKIHTQSMEKQKQSLEKIMVEWMGDEKQVDDMLVIGIKI